MLFSGKNLNKWEQLHGMGDMMGSYRSSIIKFMSCRIFHLPQMSVGIIRKES